MASRQNLQVDQQTSIIQYRKSLNFADHNSASLTLNISGSTDQIDKQIAYSERANNNLSGIKSKVLTSKPLQKKSSPKRTHETGFVRQNGESRNFADDIFLIDA